MNRLGSSSIGDKYTTTTEAQVSGWAEKRTVSAGCFGRKVEWKKRWFALAGSTLSYTNDQKGKEFERLEIAPDTPIELEGHDGRTIAVVGASSWAFRLPTEDEARKWLEALRKCKIQNTADTPPASPIAATPPTAPTPDMPASPAPSETTSVTSPEDAEKRAEVLRKLKESRMQRKTSIQLEAMEALAAIDNLEE